MLGFRFTFNQPHQPSWWNDGSLDWFWAACEREKLAVGLLAGGHMADLAGLPSVIPASSCTSTITAAAALAVRQGRRRLRQSRRYAGAGQIPERRGQIIGGAELFEPTLSLSQHSPYIRQIFDAFGPQRCFWGTDITRMPCSYRQCVTMFTEELPWLQGRDQELVMGDAICDWLGWKRPV